MNTHFDSVLTKKVHCSVGVPLAEQDARWFDGALSDHHYLGAGRSVGDYLRQIVELDGQPVALPAWGPAGYALKDRDWWIPWSATQGPVA